MSVYKKIFTYFTKSNIYKNVPIYNINWLKRKEFNKEILKVVDIRYGKPYEEEVTKSCDNFIFKLIPNAEGEIKKIAESGIY